MLGRRGVFAAILIVFSASVVAAVTWPKSPSDPGTITIGAGDAQRFLETVPVLPTPAGGEQVAVTTPETAVPPEPPPTVVVERPRGRTLRVGVAPPAQSPAQVADALGSSVPLYSAPNQAEPDDWLDNPTWEGLPVVFLVHQRQGDWLNVQVSMRPNQATAWIRASDVQIRPVTTRVLIDLRARTLMAWDGQREIMNVSVAPGLASTPTPVGDFFIDGVVPLRDTSGPYGPYQLSVAAFSDVHYSFGGGNGQIAIHGTNNPALIGSPASNGCVRMGNEDIVALAGVVTLGTPVRIIG